MNCRRLSELENDQLTDEQKRIMDNFDRAAQRRDRLYEARVSAVGTTVDLERALDCDSPPGKLSASTSPSKYKQKLRGDSLLIEEDQ